MPRNPNKITKEIKNSELSELALDPWQERFLNHLGNAVLRTGRQVGKSTVTSLKAHNLAQTYPNTTTLVIAASQRQAGLLFEKIRGLFETDNRKILEAVMKGLTFSTVAKKREYEALHSIFEDEPTLTRLRLKNGSQIYCLPTGRTGSFIRGFTVDFLIGDEAARIPEEVWNSVTPMLATSKKQRGTGWIILLSTPIEKEGFFYEACNDPDFLHIHVSSEKYPRIPKKFLAKEKKRMTRLQYAQEYLGEFIEGFRQYFPTSLINQSIKIQSPIVEPESPQLKYYLGVDVARMGRDENAFVIAEVKDKNIRIVFAEISRRKALTDTAGRIMTLDAKFHFRKIYVDATGVGGGIIDFLMEVQSIKRRLVETNNAAREIAGDKTKKTLKEDMYSNALNSMEQGRIELLNNKELIYSLKGTSYDYNSHGDLIFFGKSQHLTEAFVRACWGTKDHHYIW